jgi:hypothetical protein
VKIKNRGKEERGVMDRSRPWASVQFRFRLTD